MSSKYNLRNFYEVIKKKTNNGKKFDDDWEVMTKEELYDWFDKISKSSTHFTFFYSRYTMYGRGKYYMTKWFRDFILNRNANKTFFLIKSRFKITKSQIIDVLYKVNENKFYHTWIKVGEDKFRW